MYNGTTKIILKQGQKTMSKKNKIDKKIIQFGNSAGITISSEILGNNLLAPVGYPLKVTISNKGLVSFTLPLKNNFIKKDEKE